MEPENRRSWHVEKGIPIALIVSLILGFLAQAVGGAVWVSGVQNNQSATNALATRNETRLAAIETRQNQADTVVARMDERLGYIQRTLDEIAKSLRSKSPQ